MKVSVEGTLLEAVMKENEGKISYTLRLFQPGERELVEVKSSQNCFEPGEHVSINGRLFSWRTKDGVRSMILMEE